MTTHPTAKQLTLDGEEPSPEAKRKARAKKSAATKKKNRAAKKNAAFMMWAQKARSFGDRLKIISVDPAHSCGVAVLHHGAFTYVGTLLDADPQMVLKFMREHVTPHTVAVLEGQFFGKQNMDVMRIIERRVMIQTVLRLLGVQCITALPGDWQKPMLGKKPSDVEQTRSAWLKAKSMEAAAYWSPSNDDEADGINIARWANKKIGMSPIKGEQDR